jgi:hypothetical protein
MRFYFTIGEACDPPDAPESHLQFQLVVYVVGISKSILKHHALVVFRRLVISSFALFDLPCATGAEIFPLPIA